MKKLSTDKLRELFLAYFESKGHKVVKSDSLVPASDPSVLFTSAGMNQFKDNFLGKVKTFSRAASCQKCLRTGDLDEVGNTASHHTFFEMLGNFSFGDYFKKEAISWAWEFVTKELEISEDRLWISVYEDDEEAYKIWSKDIGLEAAKIKKFGQKDNFWPSNAIAQGPNGPCGPCSEIYYKKDSGESVELWNLVFTQYNRLDNGALEPLPNKNIDTGMGLERMSSVLQGVDTNFKIDLFVPIVDAVKRYSGVDDEKTCNIISDHIRAVVFSICDGVMPSNDGRGYVVRKLIRRSIYTAGMKTPEPFLYKVVSVICETYKSAYPEIMDRRDNVAQIIKAEEEKYIKNILEGGSERLKFITSDLLEKKVKQLDSETGLDLYMTYGVQPEFTKEYCQKKGIAVNIDEIKTLIEKEQIKSRNASKMSGSIFSNDSIELKESLFIGYEHDEAKARIIQIIEQGSEVREAVPGGDDFYVVLDKTPFYAESGGQIGDKGSLINESIGLAVEVTDTKKQGGSILHLIRGKIEGPQGVSLKTGDEVLAKVDPEHRLAVKRAHTSTHILQAALRKILGPHVQQAGSYVEADKFRFDFTHFQDIKPQELSKIQEYLNDLVIKDDALEARVMSKDEALKLGATALFGEKYEDTVRVVSIAGYSKEFCGGTHLKHTGMIGSILILSESSVGSGIRRIEALTGKLAFAKINRYIDILKEASASLKSKHEQLTDALKQMTSKQKNLERELRGFQEKGLRYELEDIYKKSKDHSGIKIVTHKFKNLDVSLLRKAVDILKDLTPKEEQGVFFVATIGENGANFACGITSNVKLEGLFSDKLLDRVVSVVGGSGGGRSGFAQGGTKDISKVDTALKKAEEFIKEGIKEAGKK